MKCCRPGFPSPGWPIPGFKGSLRRSAIWMPHRKGATRATGAGPLIVGHVPDHPLSTADPKTAVKARSSSKFNPDMGAGIPAGCVEQRVGRIGTFGPGGVLAGGV